jgi:hypothetical protein
MKRNLSVDVVSLLLISLMITSSLTISARADPWYWKPSHIDYAQSGVPDFDQRQSGTYPWKDKFGAWSHCGPVAVANSLWWLDSEFEQNSIPPPIISDSYPLVHSYGFQWDDHDPQNVAWLVEHLAFLMDTDGQRTGLAHSGTDVHDMEAGLAHYLSWTGVNPLGDVSGDGEVNFVDLTIVNLALGSTPIMPNWNLAADIFPASTIYPPAADNVVDQQDLALVMSNMGLKGMFYEHTVMAPEFGFIEEEVERCQDVVLLIGYWYFDGGFWYREPGGHYVTVAGVNSLEQKLALSDPVQDAFETGMIPEGRIPILHMHMPPEPPYVTHNDASFVSQDIYAVQQIAPPFLPCPGGNLMLLNFAGWRPAPPFFAVIEYAVVTSPVHDIAVTEVTTSKDGCLPKPTVCEKYNVTIKVKVRNQGGYVESFFDVHCYVSDLMNTYEVETEIVSMHLNPGETVELSFTWNTGGYAKGDYMVWAQADPVPYETRTEDNTFTDGTVSIVMEGDINADKTVDIFDIVRIALAFNSIPSDPNWDPNADINDDKTIDIFDIVIVALSFGDTE